MRMSTAFCHFCSARYNQSFWERRALEIMLNTANTSGLVLTRMMRSPVSEMSDTALNYVGFLPSVSISLNTLNTP